MCHDESVFYATFRRQPKQCVVTSCVASYPFIHQTSSRGSSEENDFCLTAQAFPCGKKKPGLNKPNLTFFWTDELSPLQSSRTAAKAPIVAWICYAPLLPFCAEESVVCTESQQRPELISNCRTVTAKVRNLRKGQMYLPELLQRPSWWLEYAWRPWADLELGNCYHHSLHDPR